MEFLKLFQEKGLTTNEVLEFSTKCQFLLLKEGIKSKVSVLPRQRREFMNVKANIKSKVPIFDFAHVSCLFQVGKDSKLCKGKVRKKTS